MNTTQEPAQVEESFAPKPSYGVLFWAVSLGLGVPWKLPILVVYNLTALAACIWWFYFSRTHSRHGLMRRLLGYFSFGFGTAMLPASALPVLAAHRGGDSLLHIGMIIVVSLIVVGGAIAGGFLLVFRRHEKVAA